MNPAIALPAAFVMAACTVAIGITLNRRARSRARLWEAEDPGETERRIGPLDRWLSLAGFRGAAATLRFTGACALCLVCGALLALLLSESTLILSLAFQFSAIPVIGSTLGQIVSLLPWVAALFLTALPVLLVRSARERRVAAIERDLPPILDMLATLAEGGLGFDAALDRIVRSQPPGRPIVDELRLYQAELLGGGARAECLRRLARRISVPSVTTTVAALVQAEEMGSGLADILRPLAEDLRMRRRENALARAEALPEKLVFPLVIGFLPGLLVWTLGPSFHQLMNTVDSIMRGQ